jgi:2-oxoglutarate ferredoxin oxidoreductase subunit alpha
MLRLITLWPLQEKAIDKLCEQVDTIFVPELNLGQMSLEVERINRGRARVIPLNRIDGELFNPYDVAETIAAKVMGDDVEDDRTIPLEI